MVLTRNRVLAVRHNSSANVDKCFVLQNIFILVTPFIRGKKEDKKVFFEEKTLIFLKSQEHKP